MAAYLLHDSRFVRYCLFSTPVQVRYDRDKALPLKEIPAAAEVDVVVVGSGTAGVGAAVAPGRCGAGTLVVERRGQMIDMRAGCPGIRCNFLHQPAGNLYILEYESREDLVGCQV
jgi:hypothetical protein